MKIKLSGEIASHSSNNQNSNTVYNGENITNDTILLLLLLTLMERPKTYSLNRSLGNKFFNPKKLMRGVVVVGEGNC